MFCFNQVCFFLHFCFGAWDGGKIIKKEKQPLVDCLPGFWVDVVVIQAAGVAITGGNVNVVDGVVA